MMSVQEPGRYSTMRITMLALGSRGDVLPYTTLGKALQAAGHRVRFATFENFRPLVVAHGLDFHSIRGDVHSLLRGPGGQRLAESGRSALRMARSTLRLFGVMAGSFARDLSSPALRDTDLIVNQLPGGLYGYDLAEKAGVPVVLAAVMPLTPTRHQTMLAFPPLLARVPGYNAFTHWLAYQLVWQGFRPAISRWRQDALGLSRAPLWGYARRMVRERVPVLNGFSAHLVPRPPDWGDHVHVTGYWFPEDEDWQPADELVEFIQGGSPPVFVGFGSMPVRQPERTTAVVLEALARCGQRAVLHTGWAGIGQEGLPESVYQIDYAPYAWLFPRMAAIVHHGGAGTTAFGLRAGVPAIVVPFLFDQFYWGRRISALGVGPGPIPHKGLSPRLLAEALTQAVSDGRMRERAAKLGERIRSEGGVHAAVDVIRRYVCR
jgi:UDP:flavonoid glycosyltransferase YjiC (YdhE family)